MKTFLLFVCIVSITHNSYASDMDMNALAQVADQVLQRALAHTDKISKERLEQFNIILKQRIEQTQIGATGVSAITAGLCCICPASRCCGLSAAFCGCGCLVLSTLTPEERESILKLVKTPEGRKRVLNKTHELLTAGVEINKQRRARKNSLLQAPGEPIPSLSMSDSKTSALQGTGPGFLRHRRAQTLADAYGASYSNASGNHQ